MHHYIKNILVFIFTYICALSIQAASLDKALPPILDYYPSCDYTVLENASAKDISLTPNGDKTIADLLMKLQIKAKSANADALILIDKTVKLKKSFKRTTSDATKLRYHVQYTAELIKQCKEVNISKKKLSKYNHLGHKINPALNHKTTTVFEVVQPTEAIKDVKIKNNEVSINNGLYGAQLKDSYQQVITKLGIPSTKINLVEDELIIGYGRRLWLHFQSNQLVKIQTRTHLLSQTALNKIPLHDVFDNDAWKINNKVTISMSLTEALKLLELNKPLNKNNQLVYSQSGKTLKLNFKHSKNFHTNENTYELAGFELEINDYQAGTTFATIKHKQQIKLVKKMYMQLELNQEVDLQLLRAKLDRPMAEITLDRNSTLEIFNPFLMLEIKKSDLRKVHLSQDSLLGKQFSHDNSWALGQFIYGTPREKLKKYIPQNSYESDNEVEIQSENYTLSLLFDDEHQFAPLNEAELSIWF